MFILLTILHIIVCLFLVIVVLLQSGKAADLAGAFGGMGSQTAFGPRGSATVLSKATTVAAGLFMVTSLSLAILATKTGSVGARGGSTVLERTTSTKPATPAAPAAQTPATQPPGAPVPATIPNRPAKPGEPQVTLTDPTTGATKTLPIEIPSQTGQQPKPANPAQQPPPAPPAKK